MTELLKRFVVYYRPHRGLFTLDFSSFVSIIETYPKGIADFQPYTTFVDTRPVIPYLTLTATWADHLVVLDRGTVTAEGPPLRRLSVRPSVDARIERCSRGRLHIMADGSAVPSEVRHAG